MPEPAEPVSSPPDLPSLLSRCRFPAPGTEVVCAVSGGADSLTLLVLAVAAELRVTAVHVDHGLRAGSAAEAVVVARAAARFGADFRAERVEVGSGADLEQRARLARRQVLGPDALTGHTADDQAETVLINLLRGAGPAGLAAMRPGPPHPMLALRRHETVEVCRGLGLAPVRDPGNDDPRFVRNRIRHEVLPLLAEVSSRDPVPLLARTADHCRATSDDVEILADGLDPTDTATLRLAPPTVAAAALRRWLRDGLGHPPSAAELDRVLAVVRLDVEACQVSGGRRVARTGGRLRIEPPMTAPGSAPDR